MGGLRIASGWAALTLLSACEPAEPTQAEPAGAARASAKATVEAPVTATEAEAFLRELDRQLVARAAASSAADGADADTRATELAALHTALATARRFEDIELGPAARRQLKLLRASVLPPPSDPARQRELAELAVALDSALDSGRDSGLADGDPAPCPDPSAPDCGTQQPTPTIEAEQRRTRWQQRRRVAEALAPHYRRFVELANEGAREAGFRDLAQLWRARLGLPPELVEAELERLWQQVEPLYVQLHCHVRARLVARYGAAAVPKRGPIPAHLVDEQGAGSWQYLAPHLLAASAEAAPVPGEPQASTDLGERIASAEASLASLGVTQPASLWVHIPLAVPPDQPCPHGRWPLPLPGTPPPALCLDPLADLHAALGRATYDRLSRGQPQLIQRADDSLREGIAKTIALALRPGAADHDRADTVVAEQLPAALELVAALPVDLLVDRWRAGVFTGEIAPEAYNEAWWQLRRSMQGVEPPLDRRGDGFDAGATLDVTAHRPTAPRFMAHILAFQLYATVCDAAGHSGPLHRCSLLASEAAGARLQALLEASVGLAWPDALERSIGTPHLDAGPLLAYFAPLRRYLAEQNKGRHCGWAPSTGEPWTKDHSLSAL